MPRAAVLALCALLAGAGLVSSSSNTPAVRTFKGKELEVALQNSQDFWLLLVLAPVEQCGERCTTAMSTFEKVAAKASDVLRFGVLSVFDSLPGAGPDGGDVSVRELYNITAVPALILYPVGRKEMAKGAVVDAQVAGYLLQSPKTLYSQAVAFMPSLVQKVTKHSIARFLTEEDTSLPRVLLFTDKKEVSPMFKKLSLDWHRAAVFGTAPSSDADLVKKFSVTSFPTLLVSPAGTPQDPKADAFAWQQYSGEMTHSGIQSFLSQSVPAVAPKAVRSPADFEAECTSRGGVCFVAVLPPQSSCPSCHATVNSFVQESYLTLDNPSSGGQPNVAPLPVRFLWLNGEFQTEFVSAFDRLQTPGLVALNPRKKKYATFVGAFEPHDLYEFVHKVMAGTEPLASIENIPVVKTAPEPKAAGEGKKKKKVSKKAKKEATEL